MVIIMYGCGKLIFVFLSCILLYIYIYMFHVWLCRVAMH